MKHHLKYSTSISSTPRAVYVPTFTASTSSINSCLCLHNATWTSCPFSHTLSSIYDEWREGQSEGLPASLVDHHSETMSVKSVVKSLACDGPIRVVPATSKCNGCDAIKGQGQVKAKSRSSQDQGRSERCKGGLVPVLCVCTVVLLGRL